MTTKIGIYSGSFDPIHEGHIAFAEAAIRECGLDKVYFLSEPRPRRKQGVRAFEHRQSMVQLAIKDNPNLGSIILDQERFTVHDTLPILLNRFEGAELSLLMGEDVARHLAEWPHVRDMTEHVKLIVGSRKSAKTDLGEHIEAIKKSKGLSFNYTIISTQMSSINSTKIRLSLRKGQEPEGLAPEVKSYISENNLYVNQE